MLSIAHVLPLEPHRQIVLDQLPAQDGLAWQMARHQLDILEHDRSLAKVPRKALLDHGDLADVIPAMICENAVDLVVLGTHGRVGVSKLLLRSGAEKLHLPRADDRP